MITKTSGGIFSKAGATFSDCGRYRYQLWRTWTVGPWLNYVLLNPSTADHLADDPTVSRCCRRASEMDFGGMVITNLFAWRATDPRELRSADDPVGPENDAAIVDAAERSLAVVCGWGSHGVLRDRDLAVLDLLRPVKSANCLRITKNGTPSHPLYLPYDLPLIRYNGR